MSRDATHGLISLADAIEKYQLRETRRTIVTRAANGKFPRPVDPNARRLYFRESEIAAHVAAQNGARAR
jgi:hypothetical protein